MDELRKMPQDLEAEKIVLGCMLYPDCEYIPDIILKLTPDSFYGMQNRTIYRAILTLYQNRAIDIVLLRDQLERDGMLGEVGGVEYLASLFEFGGGHLGNANHYVKIVCDKEILRKIINTTMLITQDAYSDTVVMDELIDRLEADIFNITNRLIIDTGRHIREIIPPVLDNIINKSDSGGLKIGFYEIDGKLGGIKGGDVVVIAGRPSMGKTALGLNIIQNVTKDHGLAAAVFTLEMSGESLCERLLVGESGISRYTIQKGYATDHDKAILIKAGEDFKGMDIIIDDGPQLSPLELRAKARRYKHKYNIGLVMVDYLQLMHAKAASRIQEIGYISRQIKSMARELNIPILLISQLNRQAESRTNNRPKMSDLRESGEIEQDADIVMLLYRAGYYAEKKYVGPFEPDPVAEINIAKHRNGPTGMIELLWDGKLTKFKNMQEARQ